MRDARTSEIRPLSPSHPSCFSQDEETHWTGASSLSWSPGLVLVFAVRFYIKDKIILYRSTCTGWCDVDGSNSKFVSKSLVTLGSIQEESTVIWILHCVLRSCAIVNFIFRWRSVSRFEGLCWLFYFFNGLHLWDSCDFFVVWPCKWSFMISAEFFCSSAYFHYTRFIRNPY